MLMQPGTGMGLIEHEGVIIGLAFGGDATTEHGCGIKAIRAAFHTDPTYEGIERDRVRWWPKDQLRWEDDGEEAFLLFNSTTPLETLRERILRYRLNDEDGRHDIACAWSDTQFGIRARGPMREHLITFRDALYGYRAALCLSNLFLMRGFSLILIDRFPADVNQTWIEKDRNNARLLNAWKESGVTETLRKTGKQWFSLGDRVIEDDDGTLRTWLNPMNQRKHNMGWFTFDELRQWAQDEGPVMR